MTTPMQANRPETTSMTDPSEGEVDAVRGPARPTTPTPGSPDRQDPVEEQIRGFIDGEHRRVVATVALWAGSFDDATEAVTDALGRAWEHLDRGRTIDNLAAWVTRAAMNHVRSQHRRRSVARAKRHLVAVDDAVPDPNETSAIAVDLRAALDALTDRQRHMIALYYGLDFPIADVAEALGVAPGTVKATLAQARARLAESLPTTTVGATDD